MSIFIVSFSPPTTYFTVITFSHNSNRTILAKVTNDICFAIPRVCFQILICLLSQQYLILLAVFSILWHCSLLLCSALYSWLCFYLSGLLGFFCFCFWGAFFVGSFARFPSLFLNIGILWGIVFIIFHFTFFSLDLSFIFMSLLSIFTSTSPKILLLSFGCSCLVDILT